MAELYDVIPRDEELHIASGKWNTITDVASLVASHFPGTIIQPGNAKDDVQHDSLIDPNTYISKYWNPKITLEEGIARVIKEMKSQQQNVC